MLSGSVLDIRLASSCGLAIATSPLISEAPDFCSAPADLVDLFTAALARLDGKVISQPPSGIRHWLSTAFPNAHRVYSAVGEVTGTVDRAEFADWGARPPISTSRSCGHRLVSPRQGQFC